MDTSNNNSRRTRVRAPRSKPTGVYKVSQQTSQQGNSNNRAARKPKSALTSAFVSGWPTNVTEEEIKAYLSTFQIPFKTVSLSRDGKSGKSLGCCTILFYSLDDALKMAEKINNATVDGSSKLLVQLAADASLVAAAAKGQKTSLADRISIPGKQNNRNKPATKGQNGAANAGGKKNPPSERPPRKQKPTEAELNAEMANYFNSGANGDVSGGQADQIMD